MATPRCPYCNAQGLNHLAAKDLGRFSVIYCAQCGAIYGVIPTPQKSEPEIEATPQKSSLNPLLDKIYNGDLSGVVPYSPEKQAARMKAALGHQGTRYIRIAATDGPPICTKCNREMEKTAIPEGYRNSGRSIWLCPGYQGCQGWALAED